MSLNSMSYDSARLLRMPGATLFAALMMLLFFLGSLQAPLHAEDWPEWRGAGRTGVWKETGILETFPSGGLKLKWRTPIAGGYSGPAVADGRVFITDFITDSIQKRAGRGTERVHCLDEQTGKILWTHQWEVDYTGMGYAYGPRATPTIDHDHVYVLGAQGALFALNVKTGKVLWHKDFVKDYGTEPPVWGMVGAPLVDGDNLICLVGGSPNAKVMAFNKWNGREIWRALPSLSEPGYSPPFLIEAGGARQLIVWHSEALTSLNPETGKVYWKHPFQVRHGLTIPTPVKDGPRLLLSSFYNGSRMYQLDPKRPGAKLLWRGMSDSEIKTDGLHSLISTPVVQDGYIYGIGSYGQLRCLEAGTGKRVWESMEATTEKIRWVTAFLVPNGDRFFINNDRGELMIAELSPQGYNEISRTKLIEPTTPESRRREFGVVHWSHPAYANRHIVVRNDKEIIRYSLEERYSLVKE